MKNRVTTQEAFGMLSAGKKMRKVDWPTGMFLKFNDRGELIDEYGEYSAVGLNSTCQWEEYTEPAWYDNIPEGGVLCWRKNNRDSNPVNITGYDGELLITSSSILLEINCAMPMTQEEIKLFLANAPKDIGND